MPRPDRAAAVHILEKHLCPELPYRTEALETEPGGDIAQTELDGEAAAVARSELIEVAVSRMFAPNADTDLATLTLRDGTQRTVTAKDLVSGAVLENIARAAVELACAREVEGGRPGLAQADALEAIATELETTVRGLTPHNAKSFIDGLPEDIDVVRVDRVESRARRIHRYLEVA